MIFFVRFTTALCLFAFLGNANIWLDPFSNILLAIGYRLFLILSPLFSRLAGKFAIGSSLLCASFGALLFCFRYDIILAIGAILVGIGLSVSSYLIKSEVSETPTGAALNKIALNFGSLVAGLTLISFRNRELFFMLGSAVLIISSFLSFIKISKKQRVVIQIPKKNKTKFYGWMLTGVVIGIKLFGVFSVLPQYILAKTGNLPNWYGVIVFINSGTVILLQLPIIHLIEKINNKYHSAFKLTILIMMLGMILIAVPNLFLAETFIGAFVWTFLLTLVECCASYLDVEASRVGFLFIKELAVGIGAGLTVLLVRFLPTNMANLGVGFTGILIIILCWWLLCQNEPVAKLEGG